MGDRFNTVAGWALFAGIIALGGAIVSSKYFEAERPEKMGYAIEGVEAEGEGGASGPSHWIHLPARQGYRFFE